MANYLTRFSCLLPLGKPEDVPVARLIYDDLAAELLKHEATTPGFTMSIAPDTAETALLLVSDDVADPDQTISLVPRCAARLQPARQVGLELSLHLLLPTHGWFWR